MFVCNSNMCRLALLYFAPVFFSKNDSSREGFASINKMVKTKIIHSLSFPSICYPPRPIHTEAAEKWRWRHEPRKSKAASFPRPARGARARASEPGGTHKPCPARSRRGAARANGVNLAQLAARAASHSPAAARCWLLAHSLFPSRKLIVARRSESFPASTRSNCPGAAVPAAAVLVAAGLIGAPHALDPRAGDDQGRDLRLQP